MAYKITDNSSVHCLFHSLLGLKTKGTSKILITGPLWEESLVTQLFVPKYFLALWVESSKWPVGGPHPCHYSDTTWMSQYNEYWPHDCLFHSLFRLTTKLRINGPLWVEPSEWPVTGCPSPLSLQWCHTSVSAHKIQTTRLFVPQHVWANNKQNIKSCITGPLWVEWSIWRTRAPNPCHYSDTTWASQHIKYRQLDCLFFSFFRQTTNRTSKLRISGPWWVESSEWPTGYPHKDPVFRKCISILIWKYIWLVYWQSWGKYVILISFRYCHSYVIM